VARFLEKLAADSDVRAAYMRRVQLWKVMQTMDPNDPVYMDYKAEYDSLEQIAKTANLRSRIHHSEKNNEINTSSAIPGLNDTFRRLCIPTRDS